MAFDEGSSDAAIAILRLTRKIEALEGELKSLRDAERRRDLQRAVDAAKPPAALPKGDKGDPGERGPRGETGPMPEHRWQGTKLSFQKPDGRFGVYVDLQGPSGSGGAVAGGGSSLPVGGTTGQVLAKASDANRDVEWVNQTGGGAALSGVDLLQTEYVFPTSDPQIEQAVKSISAKINEIIDALS